MKNEITLKAIFLGIILSIVLSAAMAYLGLYAGMTISASIPAAIVSMGILRLFRNSNILENNMIELKLGFSHTIFYKLPKNISIIQPKERVSIYILNGPEYNKLTQTFAKLRELKKPEPYKGKGIRYFNEIIKLKEGKKNNG